MTSLALHCTALHCTALHCTALHCTELHWTALHCSALHCTALHCTALHCTALHSTALHCTALHCRHYCRFQCPWLCKCQLWVAALQEGGGRTATATAQKHWTLLHCTVHCTALYNTVYCTLHCTVHFSGLVAIIVADAGAVVYSGGCETDIYIVQCTMPCELLWKLS